MFVASLKKSAAMVLALLPASAWGQDNSHGHMNARYAGFQERQIKSLSDQDIEELQRGGGWGLALPAELNGRPGPKHLLELKDELNLTAEQVDAITQIYDDMRSAAVAAGERFIATEAALSTAFAGSELENDALRKLLKDSAEARAELRFVHLSRHLSTSDLLSETQIQKYNVLRGYTDDPCEMVPEGHNPDMWRRHNGCE